jgi:PadR family transcriptional regulator PadR
MGGKMLMENKCGEWRARLHREMRRGFLSIWILWALKKRGAKMYGYEIIQALREKSMGRWAPKAGTIYPILRRLEEKGFVKSEWTSSKTRGLSRRYYKITPSGIKAAETAFSELKKMMVGFKEFLRELFGID